MADPPKKSVPSLDKDDEEKDDQTWVLDSLVGFLKSPLWSTSLNDFIDHNSIVFDPDDIEDDEGQVRHRLEYENIFQQYRSLVDNLIGSHMADLGINEKQFATACEMAEGILAAKLKRILFEELWAAENYEVFVRLMTKRNVELQLEALEMLVQKYGLIYDVFVPVGTSPKNFLSEEHVMREAILRSLNDMALEEDEEKHSSLFGDVADKIVSNESSKFKEDKIDEQNQFSKEADKEIVQRDAVRLVEAKQKIDRKMEEALQSAIMIKDDDNNQTLDEKPLDNQLKVSNNLIQLKNLNEDKKNCVSAEEIHKRADYLRTQRDRILQQREKERNERISKYLIKEKNNSELKKSRIVKQEDSSHPEPKSDPNKEQILAFRKALATRLKAEVIQKK